jgi:hypothetical protein
MNRDLFARSKSNLIIKPTDLPFGVTDVQVEIPFDDLANLQTVLPGPSI